MITELDAARLLVYRAAYLKDAGDERSTREASEANYLPPKRPAASAIKPCKFMAAAGSCADQSLSGCIATYARCGFTKELQKFKSS